MSDERTAADDRRKQALPMAGEPPATAAGETPCSPRASAPPQISDAPSLPSATPSNDVGQSPASGAGGMNRRHALKVMALAAAAPGLASCSPGPREGGATADGSAPGAATSTSGAAAGQVTNPNARGDLWDPDLLSPVISWERQLDPDELESLASLCDVILPADERSPSASEVGAHDFIDEWLSAPYDGNQEGGVLIRGGLVWLDREAHTRFGNGVPSSARFRDLGEAQQHAICDAICDPERAEGGRFEAPALFFDRVRYLTLTAFWTTAEGMDDLRYIGNTPLTRWDPPPPEVLRHIGLG